MGVHLRDLRRHDRMTQGMLTLSYSTGSKTYSLDCGTVTAVNDDITASVLVTPIVTYTADNAFAFDTGAVENLTFTIKRRNPDNAIDLSDLLDVTHPTILDVDWANTAQWSNRAWKTALVSMVDRWQMRTDGCTVLFTPAVPGSGDGVYQRKIEVNAYIKQLNITYDISSLEVLSVSIGLAVGTMGRVN